MTVATQEMTIFKRFRFSETEANIRIVTSLTVGKEKKFTYKSGKRMGKEGVLYPIKAALDAPAYRGDGFVITSERVYIDATVFLGDGEDAWERLTETLTRYSAFAGRGAVTIAFSHCKDGTYWSEKYQKDQYVLKVGRIDILSIDNAYVQEELSRQEQEATDHAAPPPESTDEVGDEDEELF